MGSGHHITRAIIHDFLHSLRHPQPPPHHHHCQTGFQICDQLPMVGPYWPNHNCKCFKIAWLFLKKLWYHYIWMKQRIYIFISLQLIGKNVFFPCTRQCIQRTTYLWCVLNAQALLISMFYLLNFHNLNSLQLFMDRASSVRRVTRTSLIVSLPGGIQFQWIMYARLYTVYEIRSRK